MKKHLLTCAIILLFSTLIHAQFNYTLITSGLLDQYESGFTEFEIGDIDGDGDLDIVCVGDHYSPLIPEEHGIMVFQNNGNGTSWTKVMNGDFGYGGVALGDVNNDGFMDVGYGVHHNYSNTDFGNQVLEVVLGDGSGMNWVPWDDNLGQQGQTWGMAGCDFADVDNDGLLDLGANAFGSPDGVWIYKNNGDGTWDVLSGATIGNSGCNLKFGDFDNDGKVDFIANNTQFNGQQGQVWKNNGSGQFLPMQNGLTFISGFNAHLFNFDVADINNDGVMDIAIMQSGYPRVHTFDINTNTWLNNSNGLPTATMNGQRLALGDMDNDGFIDLAVYATGTITIYKGDGSGNWVSAATLTHTETTCYDFKLADFDHNGFLDIAYWAKYQGVNMLRVYLNDSVPFEMSITPLYPKGFEFFCHGSAQFIKWNSAVPAGDTATISIDFSSTGPAGPYTSIVSNYPNSGTYQWIIPGLTSFDCYLKLTIDNGSSAYSTVINGAFGIDTCGSTPVIPGPVSGYATVCQGSAPAYSVPLTSGATSYTWTLPSGWTGTSVTNTISTVAGPASGYVSVVANSPSGNSPPQSLYVTVIVVDTSVTQAGTTLTANLAGASYQWLDCGTGNAIQGAVNQSYTPLTNGSYSVVLTLDGCVDTSACYPVIVIGLNEPAPFPDLSVLPNPGKGIFILKCKEPMEKVQIFNLLGELVYQSNDNQCLAEVNLSHLQQGVYYLRVQTPLVQFSRQIVVLR